MHSRHAFPLWSIAALAVVGLTLASVARLDRAVASPSAPAPAQLGRLTLDGGIDWINTDRPVHLDKLRGKIVLIDFWTYCCINCHHIIPTLSKLEAKYKNQLVVLGVHTAKFPAERLTENVRKKVREYNIKHPVVNDANQVIWNNFRVEGWPTLVLINADGVIVAKQASEVSYEILDEAIGSLVRQAKAAGKLDETPVQFFPEREKTHAGPLLFPGKVVADAAGKRLFISDTGNNRIVVTDFDGKLITTIGTGTEGLADGAFDKAMLNRPQGTCLVGETLYIADTENHALRAADLAARTIKTVAGDGKQADFGTRGGKGTSTSLSSPWDVLPIPETNLLAIAMAGTHQIWRCDPATGEVRVMAGSGRENIIDGSPAAAAFAQPSGLATDGAHLFVADSEVSGVRSITLGKGGDSVRTIVGVGLFGFDDIDGTGATVRLQHDLGVTYGGGKLYIADSYNNKIKVCDPPTRAVHTLVGSTRAGSTDEPPLFDEPGGLSLAGNDLYVADTNNHLIRVVAVDTKSVKTLRLVGVSAPNLKPPTRFTNATVMTAEPVKVAPGKELTLAIALALPKGYDLNAEAPLTYLVETPDKPGVLAAGGGSQSGRIDPPTNPFRVPVPLAEATRAGDTLNVKVSLQAMICLPNTLCTVKSYVWNVPVTIADGASSTATIVAK